MNKDLWLFNYEEGMNYENFSKCEDYYNQIQEYLLDNYQLSDKTVLEIGAGSGKFTDFLSKNSKRLYVSEKSQSLIEINKSKNCNQKNIEFILGDAKDLNLQKNSVDIIFAGWSLTSMRDVYEELKPVLLNLLKKNGKIIAIENAGNDEFCKMMNIENFTKEIKEKFIEIGFVQKAILNTTIVLSSVETLKKAFPKLQNVNINNLEIKHNVLVMEFKKEKEN